MKLAWIHPSWRDLVIEHLAADQRAREHFLRHAAIHGALLALSTAGGAVGGRALPLLVDDDDWDALTDRLYELVPELDDGEVASLLDSLAAAIAECGAAPAQSAEVRALAATVVERFGRLWIDGRTGPPLHVLESWIAVADASASTIDPVAPAAVWMRAVPDEVPALDDRAALERFDDWLALTELLHARDPRTEDQLGFPGGYLPLLRGFLDVVWHGSDLVVQSPEDPVARALLRITRLAPALRFRARALLVLPRATEAGVRSRAWLAGPPPIEEPLPFDVERVLRDL